MIDTQNGQNEGQGKEPVEMPATDKPVEVSAPPKEETRTVESEGKLPEEVKERTREEFEKLKAVNKKLAEKLIAYEGPQPKKRSALDVFAPQEVQQVPPQPQVPIKPVVEDIKPVAPDENGYIDINVLNQTISQINEKSRRIEAQVNFASNSAKKAEERISKYEHSDKTLKTYEKHPYLDPDREDYDEKFSELTKLEIIRQMTEEGTSDYLKAANKVKSKYYDPTKKPKSEEDSKQIENAAKRDQINALSSVSKGESEPEQEYLVSESRRGSRDAVYQRLKKSGY